MGKINVQEVIDHKDLLIPDMNYQVEIIGAEDKVAQTEREFIRLTFKIIDTIPAGLEIDTDKYRDAVAENAIISTNVFFPMDKDGDRYKGMVAKDMQRYLASFNVTPLNDDEVLAEDFEEDENGLKCGGIKVKYSYKDFAGNACEAYAEVDKAVMVQ